MINRIGQSQNPAAPGAGDAHAATRNPAGTQEHLEPAGGLADLRRRRSSRDEEATRNVRPRQQGPQAGELRIHPSWPFSSPVSPGPLSTPSGSSPGTGLPEVAWQLLSHSRESSPGPLVDMPLVESPKGNWLSAAIEAWDAALKEKGAGHPGAGSSTPQLTVHQAFTRQLSMSLPAAAGMPPMALMVEQKTTTSYQIAPDPSRIPTGGQHPGQAVPARSAMPLPAALHDLPVPDGDKALIGKLTQAQHLDPQARPQKIALHRLSNWLHESGKGGLEALLSQGPQTRQRVVKDFLAEQASRHSIPGSAVPPAPQGVVKLMHEALQALDGVREASTSTAVARSSQPPNVPELDLLEMLQLHFRQDDVRTRHA